MRQAPGRRQCAALLDTRSDPLEVRERVLLEQHGRAWSAQVREFVIREVSAWVRGGGALDAIARADEREARAMLDYAQIKAPFDGVVADRQVHTGHLLEAANGSLHGKPLFVVVRMDWVRVFVEVPEADATRVRRGNVGRINVQALNDREFAGKVAGTSWSLDPSQRTLRTEIDFRNTEGLLRPGMYVHARLDVEQPNAWMIPAGAVLVRDGESFCYSVKEGRTHRLVLRTGLRKEVLKFQAPPLHQGEPPRWVNPSGHEAIVVSKPSELIDNQEVEIKRADSAD